MTKTNLSLEERFMLHVQKSNNPDGCWLWKDGKNSTGYGMFWMRNRMFYAHRMSYALFVRPIPENLCVCHSCDIKLCVNPAHLFLGTYQDNMTDKVKKNRQSKGESHGRHKLTEQEIYQIREMSKQGYNQQEIADLFGINRVTVSDIKTQRRWKWLK